MAKEDSKEQKRYHSKWGMGYQEFERLNEILIKLHETMPNIRYLRPDFAVYVIDLLNQFWLPIKQVAERTKIEGSRKKVEEVEGEIIKLRTEIDQEVPRAFKKLEKKIKGQPYFDQKLYERIIKLQNDMFEIRQDCGMGFFIETSYISKNTFKLD